MTAGGPASILRGAIGGMAIGLVLSACGASSAREADSHAASDPAGVAAVITVTILGSGTPMASRTQAGAAILVEAGSQKLLFDCGRSCTSRLAEYDLNIGQQIDKLFLTHLHSDHVVGIPDLWLNGWTQGRKVPLQIWGPQGTSEMLEGLREAYSADLGYRNAGPGQPVPPALENHVTPFADEGGVVFDSDGVTVTAFRVTHAQIPAYGFRVDYNGKSVVISGDTSATPNLAADGAGADLVLLEVVSPAMADALEDAYIPKMVEMILRLHLTPEQAGEVFADISPALGVYYHTVTGCVSDKELLEQTGRVYSGKVMVAHDLTRVRILPDSVENEFLASENEACD